MRCKPRKRCCEKNASSCCKEHVKSIFKAVRRMWGKEMTGWQTSQHFCMRQGKCPGARLRGCALRRTRGRTRCSPTPMHPTHPSHPSLDPTLSITNSAWSITTTAQAKISNGGPVQYRRDHAALAARPAPAIGDGFAGAARDFGIPVRASLWSFYGMCAASGCAARQTSSSPYLPQFCGCTARQISA